MVAALLRAGVLGESAAELVPPDDREEIGARMGAIHKIIDAKVHGDRVSAGDVAGRNVAEHNFEVDFARRKTTEYQCFQGGARKPTADHAVAETVPSAEAKRREEELSLQLRQCEEKLAEVVKHRDEAQRSVEDLTKKVPHLKEHRFQTTRAGKTSSRHS